MVNDAATLYLEVRARDDDTSRWMLGGDDRNVIIWLDPSRGHSKEQGVQVVPDAVPPAGWGGSGTPPDTSTRPRAEILSSTAGLFEVLPAEERGVEVVRATSGGKAVIRLAVPFALLHVVRPQSLDLGIESPVEKPRRAGRPAGVAPGGGQQPPEGGDGLGGLGGLGGMLGGGHGGGRGGGRHGGHGGGRPSSESKPAEDIWLTAEPATSAGVGAQ
jgi:hypothetical protein